ncbi:hypothetical protein IF1G_06949 [Cordyceps javanica]|uniref:Uncharacterized protein n=1 Tax=Cordyceps javanica TaxID=43265 RepID=A0A545UX82_9HYPO|nr:hypothetical protein IF1G_06949 [Cordyceps javanica]
MGPIIFDKTNDLSFRENLQSAGIASPACSTRRGRWCRVLGLNLQRPAFLTIFWGNAPVNGARKRSPLHSTGPQDRWWIRGKWMFLPLNTLHVGGLPGLPQSLQWAVLDLSGDSYFSRSLYCGGLAFWDLRFSDLAFSSYVWPMEHSKRNRVRRRASRDYFLTISRSLFDQWRGKASKKRRKLSSARSQELRSWGHSFSGGAPHCSGSMFFKVALEATSTGKLARKVQALSRTSPFSLIGGHISGRAVIMGPKQMRSVLI